MDHVLASGMRYVPRWMAASAVLLWLEANGPRPGVWRGLQWLPSPCLASPISSITVTRGERAGWAGKRERELASKSESFYALCVFSHACRPVSTPFHVTPSLLQRSPMHAVGWWWSGWGSGGMLQKSAAHFEQISAMEASAEHSTLIAM